MSDSPPNIHVVKAGDHAPLIAHEAGFSDYRSVWLHADNAELRSKRPSPTILAPGDQVHIPKIERQEFDCATEERHRFKAHVSPLKLTLVLKDEQGQPVKSARCALSVGPKPLTLSTDDAGKISTPIHPTDRAGRLQVRGHEESFGERLEIRIGNLTPVDMPSGQVARLTNLAYFLGDPNDPDDDDLKSAIEEFQCDHPPLKVDGDCGAATQAKLREVHGS